MKAELRIGNYIYRNGEVATVYGIMNEVDGIYVNEGICGNDNKPIPLTEKWLLDFGAIKIDGYLKFHIIDIAYCLKWRDWANNYALYIEYTDSGNPKDDDKYYPIAFNIITVHRWQNLYHGLTGKELTL